MGVVTEYKGHKVPEGATRFNEFNGEFYKEGPFVYIIRDGWVSFYANENWFNAIKLPQEPEQYFPQTGTYCEVLDGIWHKAWYIGRDEDGSPTYRYDGTLHNGAIQFRPLKTEREKVIEWAHCEFMASGGIDEIFGDLYDMGALTMPEAK